ncbi:uncharacterized protein LOC106090826 [Stomoxys calcitrans]|uniref:uncharacterized protein LOC106090826 n=1 Tax=Stomoxys calcitrans TaxID=35570 RepID=UPI0027E3AF9F|nr:uncharacterized protein LOC106090826 [Stomoxys calcitrans]
MMNWKTKQTFLIAIAFVLIVKANVVLSNNDCNLNYPASRTYPPTNRLLIRKCYDVGDNAVDDIRFIIVEKLDLFKLEYRILQAQYTGEGLLFEMESAKDVQQILDKASDLERNGCSLERTSKTFIDVEIK